MGAPVSWQDDRLVEPVVLAVATVLIAILLGLSGCSTSVPPIVVKKYVLAASVIMAPDDSAMAATVWCLPNSGIPPISDASAVVTVDGQEVPPSFQGYMSSAVDAVAPTSNVTLHFAYEELDVTETVPLPSKPANLSFDVGANTLHWDPISPAPDRITISVFPGDPESESYQVDGEAGSTTYTFPAALEPGTILCLKSINEIGSVGAGSLSAFAFDVQNQASTEVIIP